MRRRGRIDANQNKVVKNIRSIPGVSVYILSGVGSGFPDLIVGFRGVNYLIELKDGDKVASDKKLTKDEVAFFESWSGQVSKCENFEEILAIINPVAWSRKKKSP